MIYFIKAVKTTPTRCIIHFSCRYLLTVSAGGKVDPVSLHIEVERLHEDISIPLLEPLVLERGSDNLKSGGKM